MGRCKYGFVLIFAVFAFSVRAQKRLIEPDSYKDWPGVWSSSISDNGRYVWYTVGTLTGNNYKLIIRETGGSWSIRSSVSYPFNSAVFSRDGRRIAFIKAGDTLCSAVLGTDKMEVIPNVRSFNIFGNSNSEYLSYRLKDSPASLVLHSLHSGEDISYTGVKSYTVSKNGEILLLERRMRIDTSFQDVLQWLNINTGKLINLWSGTTLDQYALDASGFNVALIGRKKSNAESESDIWYYENGMDTATVIVMPGIPEIGPGSSIDNAGFHFSKDARRLFFTLRHESDHPNPDMVSVDIWNHKDVRLQSQQLEDLKGSGGGSITCVFDFGTKKVVPLTKYNERVISQPDAGNDESMLVEEVKCDNGEWIWNVHSRPAVYLVSAITGVRKLLPYAPTFGNFFLSPTGKYIVYYLPGEQNYFSYDISTGQNRNITKGISTVWTSSWEWPGDRWLPLLLISWTDGDENLIIGDQNDLWEVDPLGKKAPLCLTDRYGKTHNMVFRLSAISPPTPIENKQRIILEAFNNETKENGFYAISIGKQDNPEKLTMGPYIYSLGRIGLTFLLQKAKDTGVYLVRRMSSTESPNYFTTTDLRSFKKISDVEPEKEFNWLKSTLIHWKTADGKPGEGILYVPEDFDPQKKYPVIFHFYEQLSAELNIYNSPEPTGYSINIPYLVSHGYLVCEPDIHYQIGYPGKSAYTYVVSAAKYLSEQPWVNPKKMGLQGHSFGGFEVNYIISHCDLFSAAMSASGMSDFISAYGSLLGDGSSRQRQYEFSRDRIGNTPWQRPDLYIENSPVLRANKITTPLLMMNNKMDDDVPFMQGVELFTALRRLNKKVWMLQYDNEGHQLEDIKNALDYDRRLIQFFDHYLKDQPAPNWMTEGVPALKKGAKQ